MTRPPTEAASIVRPWAQTGRLLRHALDGEHDPLLPPRPRLVASGEIRAASPRLAGLEPLHVPGTMRSAGRGSHGVGADRRNFFRLSPPPATLLAKSRYDGRPEALRAPSNRPGAGRPRSGLAKPRGRFAPGSSPFPILRKFLCEVFRVRPRMRPARASSATSTAQRQEVSDDQRPCGNRWGSSDDPSGPASRGKGFESPSRGVETDGRTDPNAVRTK